MPESSPEQLQIDHGSRVEVRERVDVVLRALESLGHHIRQDNFEAIEYWHARSYRLLGNLAQVLSEEDTWQGSE